MVKARLSRARKAVKRNPLDEALSGKEKLAEERRNQDVELWHAWKKDPTPENMHPLMKRFEPVFNQKVNQWKAPYVNESAFRANLKLQAIDAFKTYDPNRGTALRTHLENRLQKSMRFNTQQQNYAYIPEGKTSFIGPIQRAHDLLSEDFGRPPTPAEIAEHINSNRPRNKQITPDKVQEIQAGQIRDVIGSETELPDQGAQVQQDQAVNRQREILGLLRPELSRDQQTVFDHLYGLNGKQKVTSTGQLAKVLGKSPSQISRLRTDILNRFNQYAK